MAIVLAAALLAPACQTSAVAADERVSTDQPASDPGAEASSPADTDAGATEEEQEAPAADLSFIHNQLILKPKLLAGAERPSADVLRTKVEAATGAVVAEIRPGPAGIVLVVFASTDPPRGPAALAELQAALEATDAYEYVQPNRLYEAKSGAKSGEGGAQAVPPP